MNELKTAILAAMNDPCMANIDKVDNLLKAMTKENCQSYLQIIEDALKHHEKTYFSNQHDLGYFCGAVGALAGISLGLLSKASCLSLTLFSTCGGCGSYQLVTKFNNSNMEFKKNHEMSKPANALRVLKKFLKYAQLKEQQLYPPMMSV